VSLLLAWLPAQNTTTTCCDSMRPFRVPGRRLLSSASWDSKAAAAELVQARMSKERLSSLRNGGQLPTLSEAYDTLSGMEELMNKTRWQTAGYKVGATSGPVQTRLGLQHPFWGPIFKPATLTAQTNHAARFSVAGDLVRGVEAEFAFVIGKDIAPRPAKYSKEELVEKYCSSVMPSVEVCASRLPLDAPFAGSLTVADGAGNFAFVLDKGHARPLSGLSSMASSGQIRRLLEEKTQIRVDGAVVASGSGGDVLGDPCAALEWFVEHVVQGAPRRTLRAGQFVSTGATCGLVPIAKSCYVAVEFEHWSTVHLAFRA
jgi:2-keto-4-pentenoate hydratase